VAEVIEFKRKSRYRPEPFSDIHPLSQPWLVKGVLPARGVGFLVGQSKAGKSFVAIDMGLRLAAGAERVFGRKAKRCGVAYVAAEDPNGCRSRVTAWRLKYHRTSPTPFELIGQDANLLDTDDMADLRATLTETADRFRAAGTPLGVVIFDTLSRCIPGVDENSATDMSRAFKALNELSEALGVLVLVVAHFGKGGADKGIRGWSGMDANSDATVTVERRTEDQDLRTITFAKVKNGVDGGTLSFRLEEVDLGISDEDGDPIASCVVAYEATPASQTKRRTKALSPAEQLVLNAVRYVTDHGATQAPPVTALGVRPGQKAVTRDDVRARALDTGVAEDGEKTNTTNQRFSRALQGIAGKGAVRVEGGLVWLP
jgi:hypothetical protein